MKPILVKYQCQLCLRYAFDRPSAHRCVGGYRKRKIIWNMYYVPVNVVMIEKISTHNVYKNIMKNILKTYSETAIPYKRNKKQLND